MNTGRMDDKVHIERPDFSADGLGDVTETFSEVSFVWCQRRHLRGREADEARGQYPEASIVFEIWHSEDLKDLSADWRLVDTEGNKITIIDAIPVPGGRPEKWMIYCKGRKTSTTETIFSDE